MDEQDIIMEDGWDEKCNWKFLGNMVDNNSNRVDYEMKTWSYTF